MRLPSIARAVAVLVVFCLLSTACNRLTFVRPSAERGNYRQVGHEVVLRPEVGRRSDAFHLVQLAQSRLLTGDASSARDAAERALKIDSRSPQAHSLLASSLDALGRGSEAGRHHRQAAELAPTGGAFLNNYGIWLCTQGQAAQSLAWFDRAVLAPGYDTPALALANAAACGLKAGELGRVEQNARRALSLDPGNPVALGAMARLLHGQGRGLEARAFVERRLSQPPVDAETLLLASQIEQQLGDTAAAARYVQRLRAEFPRDSAQEGGTR